jgi:Ribosomal protein S3, C-terminal domain
MGHLINPSGMRVGWFSYWEDYWFVDFVYYPEFLHSIFRVRCFLVYFFGLRFVEMCGLIYSHFVILRNFKFFMIRAFFFNGASDEMISNFFKDCDNFLIENEYQLLENNKDFKLKNNLKYTFSLISVIRLVSFFFYKKLVNIDIAIFINLIRYFKYDELRNHALFIDTIRSKVNSNFYKLFGEINSKLYVRNYGILGQKTRFLFLVFLVVKLIAKIVPNLQRQFQYRVDYLFIKVFFIDATFSSVFSWITKFISVFIAKIFFVSDLNVKFDFFLLRNEQVRAMFLSRYIARKLQQGFNLKSLVNPIKRDLKRVSFILNPLKFGKRYLIEKSYQDSLVDKIIFKSFFIRFLSFLISIYRREFCNFYLYNHCWLDFDSFILLNWAMKNIFQIEELIGLFFHYLNYKGGFILFFNLDSFFMDDFFRNNNYYTNFNTMIIKNVSNLQICFERIFFSIYVLNIIFFNNLDLFINNKVLLKISIYYFNNVLKYKFWMKNYISKGLLYVDYYNKKDNKAKFISELLGFKLKFSGRFSRKQRASSIVYRVGRVPLNKLSAEIDYGFYSIPLKNSEISVKVWLYRSWSLYEIDPQKFFF